MSDFESELAALQAEYGASLPGKAEELARLVEAVASGVPGGLAELRTKSHRLRGTAGSYGFDRVSEVAGTLEERVKAALSAGAPPPLGELRDLVAELRAAVG